MKVVVMYGSLSDDAPKDESDSLIQVESVCQALTELGHESVPFEFSLDVPACSVRLLELNPDLVFNLVESLDGLGRLIYLPISILDCLGTPYTGASTEAMFLTSNKLITKKTLLQQGISSPIYWSESDNIYQKSFHPGRYIFKSIWEHGSRGISEDSVIFVEDAGQMTTELQRMRQRMAGECYAEMFIEGREFNLAMLGRTEADLPEILPPAEMDFRNYPLDRLRIVDYKAKWEEDSFEYAHTVPVYDFAEKDLQFLKDLRETAAACWRLFELRGYARVDFRVDEAGKAFVLEVNCNPCISPDSGFIAAAKRAGLTFPQVVDRIVRDAALKL